MAVSPTRSGPYGAARISPIHESDIVAVAVAALPRDGHRGAIHELTGPESITQIDLARAVDTKAEVLATVGTVTGRPARVFQQWADDHAKDLA